MNRQVVTFLLVLLGLGLAACGGGVASPSANGPLTSAVSEDEARSMGESMLNALNEGDYAAWSENWSQELKDAIGEDAFLEFRDQALEQRGQFKEIVSVELQPGTQAGFVRWVVTAEHEQGQATLGMGFESDGQQMTGIFWEPVE